MLFFLKRKKIFVFFVELLYFCARIRQHKHMTVSEIVASRLRLMGTSQAQIAREIGTNPTQMGVFLKGQGTLSIEVLERCLQMVGIDLTIYDYRNSCAIHVADILRRKGITQIDNLTKIDIVYLTGMDKLRVLVDVDSEDTYKTIINSGLLDPEATFPYFKALVAYVLNLQVQQERIKSEIESEIRNKMDELMFQRDALEHEKEDLERQRNMLEHEMERRKYGMERNFFFKFTIDKDEIEIIENELVGLKKTIAEKEKRIEGIKNEMERIGGESIKITSNLARTSLWSFLGIEKEGGNDSLKKTQRGSIHLFSKFAKESLNEKAMEYIREGKI